MKKLFSTLVALMFVLTAAADEGMWLPSLIGERIKDMRSKGFRLTADDVYSINRASMKDAVVLFNGGCTGELISSEGLLLTNHHCGYGAIQSHSSVEHDYLTNGFWAMSREQELPNPNLYVAILVRMEDVTDRVKAGGDEKINDNIAAIRKEASEGGRYSTSVESLYYANQYFLFVYEKFTDVRLVGAPPSSIGKFGGDTDNWMWPRQTCDFSVFRIYADKDGQPAEYSEENVPLQVENYARISTEGYRNGDFCMTVGYPGSTSRYLSSWGIDERVNASNVSTIQVRGKKQEVWKRFMDNDRAVAIKYASKWASSRGATTP